MKEAILDRHFAHWRSLGLLSAEQEVQLRAAGAPPAAASGAALRTTVTVLGGALLLAGLVLVVAENWAALPTWAKLSGFALVHAALVAAAATFDQRSRPHLAEALALAACGWVMAGVALVSQIYQLESRAPNGVWLWLALLLPGAWLLRTRATATAVAVALGAALFLEVLETDSLVHAAHADGPWVWLALPWLVVAVASLLPRAWPGLRTFVGLWTFAAANVFLLELGAMQQLDRSDIGGAWFLVAPGVLVALLLPRRVLPPTWDPTTARLFVSGALLPWALLGTAYDAGSLWDLSVIGLAWVLQIALAFVVLRAGVRAGSRAWINLAYLALLAGVVTRYFDFFGHYLEGGAALAVTGILLLTTVTLFDSSRRAAVREARAS